jgi:AP-3 complex subunit mu
VVCIYLFPCRATHVTWRIETGTFEFQLISRTLQAMEALVAEMYLGESAGGVKCVASRGDGGGNAGRTGRGADAAFSGSSSGSWTFDAKRMVRRSLLRISSFSNHIRLYAGKYLSCPRPAFGGCGAHSPRRWYFLSSKTLSNWVYCRNSGARPAHALQVRFALSSFTFSALKVDQLKVTGEVYKPYKGVRGKAIGNVEWRW